MSNKKIDLFKDNELKIYSKRKKTPEECKLPSDILIPVNDKLIKTISTSEDAVKHAIKNYGDNDLQNHISDALNSNKEFKALRGEVPSKTPKELSNYQKKYDRNDNKIKNEEYSCCDYYSFCSYRGADYSDDELLPHDE